MTNTEAINILIQGNGIEKGKVSDGYHTFDELYEHRIALFIMLCKFIDSLPGDYQTPTHCKVWKSKNHSDDTFIDGWFIMGIGIEKGHQISYHLPICKWDECSFAFTLSKAPEFDGHTSADVLDRLNSLK